jgi:hypothetical protein
MEVNQKRLPMHPIPVAPHIHKTSSIDKGNAPGIHSKNTNRSFQCLKNRLSLVLFLQL